MRASDTDRNHTVTVLREEVGTGRLTLDEFTQRADAAYRSRTVGELDMLTRDLPIPTSTPTPPRTRRLPMAVILAAVALALAITFIVMSARIGIGPMDGQTMDHVMTQMMSK
ncbi:MAG: hypothetical protein BGO26_06255 [Actinobacteria bacterium 69-20]|nr:DUF1707 domain-containing protein [Actinomycetota bacterium]OJV28053.1 MAG: hypothetical protein BGO26_06255 [Actinobacteria bacterium 69-20]